MLLFPYKERPFWYVTVSCLFNPNTHLIFKSSLLFFCVFFLYSYHTFNLSKLEIKIDSIRLIRPGSAVSTEHMVNLHGHAVTVLAGNTVSSFGEDGSHYVQVQKCLK